MAKNIFTTIQYVIDSILNHNKDGLAHEDIRGAITSGNQALSNQINVLLPLLGQKTSISTIEELNNLKSNGVYMFSPKSNLSIGGTTFTNGFVYNVKVESNLWEGVNPVVTQTITCGYSHVGDKRMLWRNFYTIGGWSDFKGVSTTDKVAFKGVIKTKDELDNKNLESGIYSVEGVASEGLPGNYYMLIVNKHELNPDYGTQIAVPYDGGIPHGMYQRNARPLSWSPWISYAYSSTHVPTPTAGVSVAHGETPRLIKVGKMCTFYGSINVNAIPDGYALFDWLPTEFKPVSPVKIMVKSILSAELPYHMRLFVRPDGAITLHGYAGALTSDMTFNASWEVA